jgi:hypothetical protein
LTLPLRSSRCQISSSSGVATRRRGTRRARELDILDKRGTMVRRVVNRVRRWFNGAKICVFKLPEELLEPRL